MMKIQIINGYYNFLMFLEDVCSNMETAVNNHRKKLDKKYWNEISNYLNSKA